MQVTGRRKVVDREDAEELLDDWADSKLDFRKFCELEQVDGRSLQCWRTNLGRRGSRNPGMRLVELTMSAAPVAAPRALYRVLVGEIAVEVDDSFREETLARLLGVVARWPHRNKRIGCLTTHDKIYRLTRGARPAQGGIQGAHGNYSISVQVSGAFTNNSFDGLIQLRGVTRLNIATRRFSCLDLQ